MVNKIVHICMCGPVTDGWTYQDNLLPKYHKRIGLDVTVITSEWIWGTDGKMTKDTRKEYINEYGIKVIRLSIQNEKMLSDKFKRYLNLIETIEKETPDILFIHGCQFLDLWKITKYLKKHDDVRVFLDNHADFSNSGSNFLSKEILHKKIWRAGAKAIEPYVTKFYGVLPARVEFMKNMYHLPKRKLELLVMGADDDKVLESEKPEVIEKIRKELDLHQDDFIIITGGKIDYAKRQTLLLMQAVKELTDLNVKLLVFGSVEEDMKKEFTELYETDERIKYLGWLNAEDTYQYFAVSNLAVFPGRHSVIWEQAAGQGIPIICKYWDGTTHVDVGGNAKFLYEDSVEEIKKVLEQIIGTDEYQKMKDVAEGRAKKRFSYLDIAKRAIE